MRKVAFVKQDNPVRKLMIFESTKGVYLFGYDCVEDNACIWDLFFSTANEAEEEANEKYNLNNDDWINIADPKGSTHDLISARPFISERSYTFGGWTTNERLFLTGLTDELEKSIVDNKENAIKMLKALRFDIGSINIIVNKT